MKRGRRGGRDPWRGRKPKGGTGRLRRLSPMRQRTSAEGKARKAGEDLSNRARQGRLSQRQAGWSGRKARIVPRKGKPSKGGIPRALLV